MKMARGRNNYDLFFYGMIKSRTKKLYYINYQCLKADLPIKFTAAMNRTVPDG